jgi:phosphohistidine swiveling domain-containing protein
MALELGARLHRDGALAQADDVFYLRLDELNLALVADAAPGDYRDLIEARRELQSARRQLSPPFQIPEPAPADGERTMNMWGIDIKGGSGAYNQVDNADSDSVLQGFACSPGVITAAASVIRTPAEFANMQPGSILVCPTTTPVWTELFSQAAGLVTDTGGILAHGSIVAREYGIPAVLGTGNITTRIVSGTIITVDGNRGLVQIGGED